MLKIIFEDQDILILEKDAGLVVDKSETQKDDTLEDLLARKYQDLPLRAGIVHRLDKDTSGVILVAKTKEALENLQAQFKGRKIKKEYLALVHGLVETPGRVEGNIGRNPINREKFMVVSSNQRRGANVIHPPGDLGWHLKGKEAVTEYSPEERLQVTGYRLQEIFSDLNKIQFRKLSTIHYNLFTLLKCFPQTGRTHQIRVHLKYIGHPIVADEKYVGRKMYRLDKRWCPRMFLHAQRLGFYHPTNGEWMVLESELSEDLKEVLDVLK